ncbi:hypothetical protein BDM02DRAFT_3116894, partial [Thelephora ganbajun]
MISAYPLDLKERVVRSYLQREMMRMVAETFRVSLSFMHRIVDLYWRYGQTGHRPRRHILTAADKDYIRSIVRTCGPRSTWTKSNRSWNLHAEFLFQS